MGMRRESIECATGAIAVLGDLANHHALKGIWILNIDWCQSLWIVWEDIAAKWRSKFQCMGSSRTPCHNVVILSSGFHKIVL
jgi:hypothetical protein